MLNKANNNKRASLTIEMSLLMPGIITVLLFLIHAGFYYSDKCLMERSAYTSVLRCSEGYVNDVLSIDTNSSVSEMENCVKDYFYKEIDGRLVGKWDLSVEAYVYEGDILIDVIGTMQWPGGFFTQYLSDKVLSVNISEHSYRHNLDEYIWNKSL